MGKDRSIQEENLFPALMHKYAPYWPLFLVLIIAFGAGAWAYLHYYAIPSYKVTATLVIRDEKKGVNESRMAESIDAFTSNKIVENEIKVLKSHSLINQVVDELRLYAPIFEEGKIKTKPAYVTSPVNIELKYPRETDLHPQVYFTYNRNKQTVKIGKVSYPIKTWVKTPYGTMRFSPNMRQKKEPKHPLYFSLIPEKQAVDGLFNRLTIEAENKLSSVVNLQLEDPSPERGEDVLNALIQAYNQVAIIERDRLAASTLEFVENRIRLVEEELDKLENQVVQFKSSQGAVDLSEQGKMFLKNVGENDRRISEINSQLAILDKVESYVILKSKTAGIVPATLGVDDPVLSQLLQKLYDSEIQYQKLRTTTAENNPILTSLSEEIEKIRPSILENIRNQRTNLQASKSTLTLSNNQYNIALQTIPQKERELLEISRQQAIKNNAYSFLLQKREETVLSYAPTASNSRVIDDAVSSTLPVSPRPLYVYLIAMAAACLTCIGFVSAKEFLNTKLLFRSEIENFTDAPIVAEIAYVKHPKSNGFQVPTEATVIEQFRQLRTTMGLYGRTFTKKKIMVTSSIPGEGKSYISTNLAYSLASSGRKVILLDLDLRNPNTTQLFDMLDSQGITEYLREPLHPTEIVRHTEIENLSVIPAGLNIGDHTELLLNSKLDELFNFLEHEFDYIIVDTPPLELVSDAYLLSEYCDTTLLVMRHAYTPKGIVHRLAQSNKLKSLQNTVAIVFNGVKPRGFVRGQYGYGYGYGYEFKYGNKAYKSRVSTVKS